MPTEARHTLRAAQRRWSRYSSHQIRRANRLFASRWPSAGWAAPDE